MKRLILLVFLTTLSEISVSQTDFCLPGATWVYYHQSSVFAYEFERKVVYAGDTVIEPFESVQTLDSYYWQRTPEQIYETRTTSYFAQKNDSVMGLVGEDWEFLFDYEVEVGDVRVVYIDGGECSSHDTMLIESIDTISFQGMELRRFNYKLLIEDQLNDLGMEAYSWNPPNGSYVEKLGFWKHSPLGEGVRCITGPHIEHFPLWLTCYSDDNIISNGGDYCQLALEISQTRQTPNSEIFLISNELQVQNASNATLRVYDILGKELLQTAIRSINETIDVSHLPNGILIVSVDTEARRVTQKLLKPATDQKTI
ncbi:MAG: hypothetical protein ACJAYA_001324 [Bacteroidia bacterium]|jgi:hypothetical protein